VTSGAFGFNVYGDDCVAYGSPTEDGATGTGIRSITYSDDGAAHLLIQVYNYADGTPVSYDIEY